ncbi:hypothetical protein KQI52_13120 [bacterium]|nr:hypothetical protein [bacterium]
MFKLTRNLKIFAAVALVATVAFHWTLSWLLTEQLYVWIWPLAGVYCVTMFFNGLLNGRQEDAFLSRADFSFSYHLMTYIIVVPVWLPFILTRPTVDASARLGEGLGMLGWGVGLLIHYFVSRHSIKGYSRDEVFD